ncbi:hypothetical protein KIL84_023373 [Mauremys mutica]|uniref:Uncharacterized protein n=1 Tax=Mauremys mutica TaxID=74926 RepID=A0A9D3WPW9_9SAUR|nr:hypothetical protein KIL84_023373 [Mauremys mutica]
MDLFGDFPEPDPSAAGTEALKGGSLLFDDLPPSSSSGKEAQTGPLLFDDLPPVSSADSGTGGPLLFDDLPPASSGDSASCITEQVSAVGNHGKGEKRKISEEEKNGREELVEKKHLEASLD